MTGDYPRQRANRDLVAAGDSLTQARFFRKGVEQQDRRSVHGCVFGNDPREGQAPIRGGVT
jgi:hypothetical protein